MSEAFSYCNICDRQAERLSGKIEGYKAGTEYPIYSCTHCDAHFSHFQPGDEGIYEAIYKQARVLPGYNRYYYYYAQIKKEARPLDFLACREAMYWAVREVVVNTLPTDGRILEVGSGLGYLTYAVSEQGYQIQGVDISLEAVQEARSQFGDLYLHGDIFDLAQNKENQYDLIILNEVIEHVPEPKTFAATLMRMLKKGGKLLITTPNKSIALPHAIWDTELPPVHLWWLSEKAAHGLAEGLHCKIQFVDFRTFNKISFDKARFFIYRSSYSRPPLLNKEGQVIAPAEYRSQNESFLKRHLQRIITRFAALTVIGSVITRKVYPVYKNTTLAFILTKK